MELSVFFNSCSLHKFSVSYHIYCVLLVLFINVIVFFFFCANIKGLTTFSLAVIKHSKYQLKEGQDNNGAAVISDWYLSKRVCFFP